MLVYEVLGRGYVHFTLSDQMCVLQTVFVCRTVIAFSQGY